MELAVRYRVIGHDPNVGVDFICSRATPYYHEAMHHRNALSEVACTDTVGSNRKSMTFRIERIEPREVC